jgi:hypothetical protein
MLRKLEAIGYRCHEEAVRRPEKAQWLEDHVFAASRLPVESQFNGPDPQVIESLE